ncbi:ATP-dependent helicase [Rhodovastum atsumiense]|uniref:ATP-dependent helicase n=1 Tax=Rhodovastum atsumiense TaxID=504468 RepID=A0A5M6ILN2_9PROT|nr:DEAD/DEAH box helicase [Rhodovastum atsumiense]KAA5609183.1 ATP-dependent helicase [Rhodovastum atsumiense]CAH2602818.1 ATP-dependent helicase [Rhodovastum atsumiense]
MTQTGLFPAAGTERQPASAPAGPAKLLKTYGDLPAGERMVLRLKALVGLPTNKTTFFECLTRGNLRTPEGRAWNGPLVNAALERLRRQRMLTEDLACVPALLHPVAIDAVTCAGGAALVAAVRRAFAPPPPSPYSFGYTRTESDLLRPLRLGRLAIYTNDPAEFALCGEQYERMNPGAQISLAATLGRQLAEAGFAPDWLDSRDPALQVALVEGRIAAGLGGAPGIPGMVALVERYRERQDQPGLAPVRTALLAYALMALRLEEARGLLARLQADAAEPDPVHQGIAATLLFLAGDNAAALELYRAALKLRRKQTGKRKLFLDGLHGLCFGMALLRANDAALHAEIEAGINAVPLEGRPDAAAWLGLRSLLWLAQGKEGQAREQLRLMPTFSSPDPLTDACWALAAHAVDPAHTQHRAAEYGARFEALRDSLALPARIYAEILADVAPHPTPYVAYLDATSGGIGVRFTGLLCVSTPWERALESLGQMLFAGEGKPEKQPAARKAKRLAWFVDPDTLHVEVAEQLAKGRDGWTDGRPVALKRLFEQDPRLDYLTEADRRALRGIRRESAGWYQSDHFYDFEPRRVLPALVGHPVVFDARTRHVPIELVAYPVELVVSEERGGLRIALSHTAEAPCVFLEAETPQRYRVIEVTQKLLELRQILGAHGLTVPKAGRERVVEMVRRANPALPIRAEIAAVDGAAVEGIVTPVVQLLPQGDPAADGVLQLRLLVRPFGAEGPAYVAGLGGHSVLAPIGGTQVRARRDLAAELAARRALVEACPTLRDRGAGQRHEVTVEGLEACLDLMLELQAQVQAGAVLLEWPEGRKLSVSPVESGQLRFKVRQVRDWFSVGGEVAVAEDEVVEMRFLLDRLDRAQGRFVPLEDGRFLALTERLQAQLRQLAAVAEAEKGGHRVHALGAVAVDGLLEGAGRVEADAAWRRHVTRLREAGAWTPAVPKTLQAELRDYQEEGFVWLARLARLGAGACLADDMGLGKTVQAIAVMLHRAAEGPCLVVAPTSVVPNWAAELERFAPTLRVHRLAGAADRAALVAGLGKGEVLLCSYGLLHQEVEALAGPRWQMVVLDEAQAIKNADTRRAQAIQRLQAGFRLALTGTPVENDLDELWSLFAFVTPGLLGSREKFQRRFAGPIGRDRDPAARAALRALLRPFLLRRTKAAVLAELPARTEQTVMVEMEPEERAFYEALRRQALDAIAALEAPAGRRKIHILAEIGRLRQACCNPALIDAQAGVGSAKLAAFLDLVEELRASRHRALVFSQFVGHLALVRAALDARGVTYQYLDGATPAAERERRVAAFQAGEGELFLISLRAGGTGLNLTAADYVVHLDPWWNPAVEDQASDRAHRIGQTRPVTIYRLVMQGSIEEGIVALHRDKRNLAAELLEGADAAGRLTEQQLLELIGG